MTKNVMKDDIERCFLSGMNDHIEKPLESDNIISDIESYFLLVIFYNWISPNINQLDEIN